jgi:condensin complex subunit 3
MYNIMWLVPYLLTNVCSDVRRAVLCNIPVTSITLPAILGRTRDTDTTMRRLVFDLVLLPHAKNPHEDDNKTEVEMIGVAHPRALSIAQRELIVRHGLGDREEIVRNAAAKVLQAWVDVTADPQGNAGPGNVEQDLLTFLRMFDLGADQTAEDALTCIFTSRPEILDALRFDGADVYPGFLHQLC